MKEAEDRLGVAGQYAPPLGITYQAVGQANETLGLPEPEPVFDSAAAQLGLKPGGITLAVPRHPSATTRLLEPRPACEDRLHRRSVRRASGVRRPRCSPQPAACGGPDTDGGVSPPNTMSPPSGQ